MPKKFYYAVRKGKVVGVLKTWDECKDSVHGFPGAEYKKFTTLKEAKAYVSREEVEIPEEKIVVPENTVYAYVDGSFNATDKKYGYGVVMIYPDGTEKEFSGFGNNEDALVSRNVSGELLGSMVAIKEAVSNGVKNILIFHDYKGIEKWITGEWQANAPVSIAYKDFVDKFKDRINIKFKKVAAHTGDKYNEIADVLAKEGAGI